jgi:RNA polymerase sigma factor (sigma-70 family)
MIARNLYRADCRQHARHEVLGEVIDRAAPGPETSAMARFDLERVLARLQQLPAIDRAVLLMRAENGMSYEEIAASLGISVGAARVKAHRARARLAEIRAKEDS